MKRKQVDIILEHQRKRRAHKIKLLIPSILFIMISIIFISIYINKSKNKYVGYHENASLDYKTYLKQNDFYEQEYLEKGNDIVASLIKKIEANLNYKMTFDENIEYRYEYEIISNVQVKEKNSTNAIFDKKEQILRKEIETQNNDNIEINEKIEIIYDNYNQLIKNFVKLYDLNNMISSLTVEMYVDIYNIATGEKVNSQGKVLSLEMPLTTQTVNIQILSNAIENNANILVEKHTNNTRYLLILGIITLIVGVAFAVLLIKYMIKTISAETVYEKELRRILRNYKSYIQKINNEIDRTKYEILRIDTFNEMLEIRDTIQKPILMYHDKDNRGTTFLIINDNMAFEYTIRIDDIRQKFREMNSK